MCIMLEYVVFLQKNNPIWGIYIQSPKPTTSPKESSLSDEAQPIY